MKWLWLIPVAVVVLWVVAWLSGDPDWEESLRGYKRPEWPAS